MIHANGYMDVIEPDGSMGLRAFTVQVRSGLTARFARPGINQPVYMPEHDPDTEYVVQALGQPPRILKK